MIVWMVADRALDIIGLYTLCYWTWKIARWHGWGRARRFLGGKGEMTKAVDV